MSRNYQNVIQNGILWGRCLTVTNTGLGNIMTNQVSFNPITVTHMPIRSFQPVSAVNYRVPSTLGLMAYREFNFGNYVTAENYCNQWLAQDGETYDCYILLAFISQRNLLYDKVERYAEKALTFNSIAPEPYVLKGIVAREKGKIVEAMNFFRYALQLRPDHIDSLVGLSNCFSALNDYNGALTCLYTASQKNPDSLFLKHEIANLLRSSGRLDEARKCYEALVEKSPEFALAWMSLGHVHLSLGSHWLALHSYEKALQSDQYLLEAYFSYATLLKELKLSDKAVQIYHKAISLFPSVAPLYAGLAGVCHDLGWHDYAIENFRQAISLHPNYPDAYCNLANVLKEKGLTSEAEKHYAYAIQLSPVHADSYNNLANILRERGKVNECIALYRKALEIVPNFAAAHSNLATVFQQCGKINDAIVHFQLAVDANPGYCEGHCFLGNALKETGNYKAAVECFAKAININPYSPDAHAFLGITYKDIGQFSESILELNLALKYRPNFNEVYCNLVHCYLIICKWIDYDQNCKKVVSIVQEQIEKNCPPSVHPHHTMLFPIEPWLRKEIAARHAIACYEKVVALGYAATSWSDHHFPPDQVIKLGYVSSDFGNHPTSHLIESVPGLHDRKRFKVYCYSLNPSDQSSFRIKLEKEADHFIDVSSMVSPLEVANLIKSHGIHILLNLNGYTKGARNEIFALKPAPIQVMYLGYPGTSGATYMDYLITDKMVSPIEYEDHYSEKFAYMPNSFFIGDHSYLFPHVLKDLTFEGLVSTHVKPMWKTLEKDRLGEKSVEIRDIENIVDSITLESYIQYHTKLRNDSYKDAKYFGEVIPERSLQTISRSSIGLNKEAFVYCNFNQLYKFDPDTFSCWCRILKRVPNSYLWILRFPKQGEDNLREYAKKFDIPSSRIIFTDVAMKEEHVRRGQLADVCLDTPICNGHTTGMDVLWAGCPVVTTPRETFASRVGASIVNAIGLGKNLLQKTWKSMKKSLLG
ncbi:UDP-N-acetylglucosamine--peptide N-acetylglucosaminyltransferase subunit [Thelohanellus kitauei]|uniref:protein O-GlcNAc transferase n=1 Tax=Thelohanellus kitauei TaxID=669202 RepID=A0A0C2MI47_THEKT|nr:UDP-N-acetylglucosamine--peptide N-acetylglucosaminyltransferase subunit [Thelohanellus kitauei]